MPFPEPNMFAHDRESHPGWFSHTHKGWYFLPAPSPPARPLHKEQSQASLVTLTSEPLLPSSQNVKHLAGMCCLAAWWGWWSCSDVTQAVPCPQAPSAHSSFWAMFALQS